MTSDKIRPHHLARKAILYVRQSSAHQVLHNRESSALQYAMRDRLAALGWSQIETVDDDLGRSAAGGIARAGFERMVAEVCLGKVGAVAAREVSRFARNSRDWQQLIEMCRVVDTVLIDQETVYAPRQGNDRLLLGLKGSLNEYELDLLRQRSLSARYEKARRGELVVGAPVGFVKAGDRLEKDPDRRVQEAIMLVFDKVPNSAVRGRHCSGSTSMGSICRAGGPMATSSGAGPCYATIYSIISNPAYGGAYAYGKTRAVAGYDGARVRSASRRKAARRMAGADARRPRGLRRTGSGPRRSAGWSADNVPTSRHHGAPKHGDALLAGLLRCRRCGRKLTLRYTGTKHDIPRYACQSRSSSTMASRAASPSADCGSTTPSRRLCSRSSSPGAIAAAVAAETEAASRRDQVREALVRDLEAARYAADRAFRQYDAADPANRLVAGELETRWNKALARVAEVEAKIAAHDAATPGPGRRRSRFATLAADLKAVWTRSDHRRAAQEAHRAHRHPGGGRRYRRRSRPRSCSLDPLDGRRPHRASPAATPARPAQQHLARHHRRRPTTGADRQRRSDRRHAQPERTRPGTAIAGPASV